MIFIAKIYTKTFSFSEKCNIFTFCSKIVLFGLNPNQKCKCVRYSKSLSEHYISDFVKFLKIVYRIAPT